MEIKYNVGESSFYVESDGEEVILAKFKFDSTPQNNCFDQDNPDEYDYFWFYKKDVQEADYHKVYVNLGVGGGARERCGWILPVSVLTTEDNAVLSEKHLSPYAYLAYHFILSDENVQDKLLDEENISDVFDNLYRDKCLYIVKKTQTAKIKYLKNLELPFAEYGFFTSNIDYSNPVLKSELSSDLTLTPVHDIVKSDGNYIDSYIPEYYSKYIEEKNIFLKFMYLYQIYEVLLDDLLITKLEDLLTGARNHQISAREVDTSIKEYTEMKRLNKVLTDAGMNNEIYEDLDKACNTFLNRKNTYKQPESIYQCRCHIVHCFRDVIADAGKVETIVRYLELYTIRLLCKYKIV